MTSLNGRILAACCAALVAACGGGSGGSGSTTAIGSSRSPSDVALVTNADPVTSVPVSDMSAGCSTSTEEPSGQITASVVVDGTTTRKFFYQLSDSYVAGTPSALTIYFHGADATGSTYANMGLLEAADALSQPMIILAPNGRDMPAGLHGNSDAGWDITPESQDVHLYDTLVAWAAKNLCVNPHKIYVTGFSWGAEMAAALGCYRGNAIDAVQIFTGTFGADRTNCTQETPAVRMVYNAGGEEDYSEAEYEATAARYAAIQACSSTTYQLDTSSGGVCQTYQNCTKEVTFCPIPNLGHTFPSDAGTGMLAFFNRIP